ncbi:uncharacterized protein YecE (DUF72 family) [Silvibacterium bohemicum]|uniref:Uncharacterized protein YecE (DUF72 family) n=1 Tax=Silvibacterium bohemicum TaxID=1577686 RepID=A0A841K224_9BACT|nr:DUF72 domain-containing protein [Silvibacterium bohemicum]MBB6145989.1 uncharacterized protein YecE (DUF72 family) [Silvibacterium bohemicum]
MDRKHGKVRIGISGWTYAPWRGVFYPPKLPQKQELSYSSRAFSSIEINGSFYSLQRPTSYQRWRDETPDDFVFAVKGSRFITHMLKLRNAEKALANFFASGLLALGPKLGPILWQFPPQFSFQPERIESFFKILPKNMDEAGVLASGHDLPAKDRAFVEPASRGKIRHAMEIRHPSFVCEEFIALLRKHRVALVCADTVEWPRLMDVTADFIYCRLHGSAQLYVSGYGPKALDRWATRVADWASGGEAEGEHASATPAPRGAAGRDVYVYFDNDAKVRAPVDAQGLIRRVEKLTGSAGRSTGFAARI